MAAFISGDKDNMISLTRQFLDYVMSDVRLEILASEIDYLALLISCTGFTTASSGPRLP